MQYIVKQIKHWTPDRVNNYLGPKDGSKKQSVDVVLT